DKAFSEPWYNIQPQDLRRLHMAACLGQVAKVEDILSFAPSMMNEKDCKGRSALHLACAIGQTEVVRFLVHRKCKLNTHDRERRTPLMKAVQCQQEECVAILLESGANVHLTDVYHNTALHYAAYHQNIQIADRLLAYGSYIDPQNKNGSTPLLLAINENRKEMVEFLLKNKANRNSVDKFNSIPQQISEDKEEKVLGDDSQNSSPGNMFHFSST
uniref:Uncharacterized protein n=1 Tax=Otolemur garnettii TaxID=30611 RepID=H0WVM3_OTOGA